MSFPEQIPVITPATVINRTRIFPFSKGSDIVSTTKALSIVDGSVVRYSATSATWFFDAPTLLPADTEALSLSLRKTLDVYPQWAGSLHMPHPNVVSDSAHHTQRFNRPQLTWGTAHDPGVEFIEARSLHPLSLLPIPAERADFRRGWDASLVASLGVLSDAPKFALHDLVSSEGLPCMIVQITTFACGGVAIAVKFAHPLADAQTLLTFIHDWAKIHRGLMVPRREFVPELLDEAAEGNIDAPVPDHEILARSKAIPLHRFDWWASATPECPSYMLQSTEMSPAVKTITNVELGNPLPWATWNILVSVQYYVVYFTRTEIMSMWEAAVAASSARNSDSSNSRISKLDALLAHVWTLIVRARRLPLDDSPVHLDVTIGLRTRLSPPLSPHFLGSPLLNIPVSQPVSQLSIASAVDVRSSLSLYDPSTLGAYLHEMAYLIDPARRWNAFLGDRHTIVTSWLENRTGMGAYDVDFGFGSKPRMVDPLMPESDGVVQIMESGLEASSAPGINTDRTPWYSAGVSVNLHLREDVMMNLLSDPWLRKYR